MKFPVTQVILLGPRYSLWSGILAPLKRMEELPPGDLNWCRLQLSECRPSILIPSLSVGIFLKGLWYNILLIIGTRNVWCEYFIVSETVAKVMVSQRSCCRKNSSFFPLAFKKKKVSPVEETLAVLALQTCVGIRNRQKLPYSLLLSSRWFPSKHLVGDVSKGYGTFSVDPKKLYQWVIELVLLQRYKYRIYLKRVIKHFQRSLLVAWFCKTGILKCNSHM